MEVCAPHAVPSAVQSSVDEFRSQDFGLKLNCRSTYGIGLVYSILSGTLIRPASFVIDCSCTPVPWNRFGVGVWMRRLIYGGGFDLVASPVTTY
jgi:hypothetical protein